MKTAFVTGSSRGIGRAIAIRLAKDGYKVIVHGASNIKKAEETKTIIEQNGGVAEILISDLTNLDNTRDLREKIRNIDVLILNASLQYRTPWQEITTDACYKQLNCNFVSSMMLIQASVDNMKNKKWGRIVTIGSICCFCLVALLGIGLWQGDFFGNTPSVELEDSTIIDEQDYIELEPETNNQSDGVGDVIGMVKYGGANYIQCSTTTKTYTPDKYLGEAYDFEGTYQTNFSDIVGGLYMTKEDPDVLMVELKNSEYTDYVILIKEQKQSNKQG